REIHDMGRTLLGKQRLQLGEIMVEIDPRKAHASRPCLPFVGQECLMRFLRPARREHVMTQGREMIGHGRARKRVRAEDQEFFMRRHVCRSSATLSFDALTSSRWLKSHCSSM